MQTDLLNVTKLAETSFERLCLIHQAVRQKLPELPVTSEVHPTTLLN